MAATNTSLVTINVTIAGGTADAPAVDARRGDDIVWVVDGDLDPADEVHIRGFVPRQGGADSPMTRNDPERKRQGKGPVNDKVKGNAQPGMYHYDIAVTKSGSGAVSIVDPEIQIKP